VGNPEGKRPLRRIRRRFQDNMETYWVILEQVSDWWLLNKDSDLWE
jgi:hypothetical protein